MRSNRKRATRTGNHKCAVRKPAASYPCLLQRINLNVLTTLWKLKDGFAELQPVEDKS